MDGVEQARATFYQAGDQFLRYCLRFAEETGTYTDPLRRRSAFQKLGISKADLRQLAVVQDAGRALEEERENLQRAFEWATLRNDYVSATDLVYALGDHLADWGHAAELESWAREVLEDAKRVQDSYSAAMMQRALGYLEAGQGNSDRALELYTQALAMLREDDDIDVRASLYRFIGDVYSNKGAWDQALEWLESAKQEFSKLEDLDGLSSVYIALGDLYCRIGDWEKARSNLAEAQVICEESGDLVADLAPLYNNLGGLCRASGRLEEAIDFFRKDLAISQQVGIPQGLGTARLCLASALIQAQSFDEAYELLELARADFEGLNDVSGLAELEVTLGSALARQEKWDLAVRAYERARGACERLGDTRRLARVYSGMAAAQAGRGDDARARHLYDIASSIYDHMEDMRGVVDDFTWTVRRAYADQGKRAEAIARYKNTLSKLEQQDNLYGIAQVCDNLADTYSDGGDWVEAKTVYERELALWEQLGDKRRVAAVCRDLGRACGHIAEASSDETLHGQAIGFYLLAATTQERLGDQLNAGWTYEQLGDFCRKNSKEDDAGHYYAKALIKGQEVGDPSFLGWVLSDLGHLHASREDWDKAIEFHRQALTQRQLRADQTLVGYSYDNLAYCYLQSGALDQSLDAYTKSLQCWENTGNMTRLGLAHQVIGSIRIERKEMDQAIGELEVARTLLMSETDHTELVNVIRSLAYAYREQGQWEQTINCYQQALSIGGDILTLADVAEVHSALGDGYAAKADWESAAMHYDIARSSYTGCDGSAGVAYTALSAAQARAELGEVDREIGAYQEALVVLDGQDQFLSPASIYIGLGNAYSKKEAWQEAIHAYTAAADLATKSGDVSGAASAHWHLGFTHVEAGDYPAATEHLRAAASFERQAGNQEQADEVDKLAQSLEAK